MSKSTYFEHQKEVIIKRSRKDQTRDDCLQRGMFLKERILTIYLPDYDLTQMMIVQMYNAILIHRTMSLYTATIMKVLSESEQEVQYVETK